jgi:hypothetical protein
VNGFRPVGASNSASSGDSTGGTTARFRAGDAAVLAELATQVAVLIAERGETGEDPVLDRLLPDAYRDSPEDAAEFRRFTESELGDDKVRGALMIAEALEPAPGRKTVTVVLDLPQSISWLRSLTDIRLALATRIGIDDSGLPALPREPASADQVQLTFALYNWLGALQESLVRAVDR